MPTFLMSARTDIGRSRRRNEDCVLASTIRNFAVLAVADGMGGVHGGEVGSRTAIDSLYADLSSSGDHSTSLDLLREAFAHSVDALRERAKENNDLSEMGTTLTCIVLTEDRVSYAHLGDSRGYLFRDGRLRKLTTDHNRAQELLDEGRISLSDATTHPSRNVLTRWVSADIATVDPEVGAFKPESNDVYLLCTDGLHTLIPETEIEESLQDLKLEQAALDRLTATLIDRANQRGGTDNISIVVAACGPG